MTQNSGDIKNNEISRFNIRVYGILMDDNKRILVSDEYIRGMYITKFPGGGLELGEGTRDCLKREFMEETGLEVIIGEHLYTTDFFQMSAFRKNEQIISIYYLVHPTDVFNLSTKTTLFDFTPEQVGDPNGEAEVFRWIEFDDINDNTVSLPIDKLVLKMMKERLMQQ
jgi:8-oxo-dGTP pyrophosphatase MutT (NUDIX family)